MSINIKDHSGDYELYDGVGEQSDNNLEDRRESRMKEEKEILSPKLIALIQEMFNDLSEDKKSKYITPESDGIYNLDSWKEGLHNMPYDYSNPPKGKLYNMPYNFSKPPKGKSYLLPYNRGENINPDRSTLELRPGEKSGESYNLPSNLLNPPKSTTYLLGGHENTE